jgi:hypothetical protein
MKYIPIETKFLVRVQKTDGCWLWKGRCSTSKGGALYGILDVGRSTQRAHRISYTLYKGPIPEGLTIDHLCRNTLCVNPGHLEAVTVKENILRGDGLPAKNARKRFCKNGHEFTPENCGPATHGKSCRICVRKANREWMRKKWGFKPRILDANA